VLKRVTIHIAHEPIGSPAAVNYKQSPALQSDVMPSSSSAASS
jgi:hypothetical protein